MSIAAYQQAAKRVESPRETEWRAFQKVTSALQHALDSGALDVGAMIQAINDNRALWAVLADDCAQPDNQLPGPLRAQIISLALWVDRHSSAVRSNYKALADLIEINRAIMDGLAGQGQG